MAKKKNVISGVMSFVWKAFLYIFLFALFLIFCWFLFSNSIDGSLTSALKKPLTIGDALFLLFFSNLFVIGGINSRIDKLNRMFYNQFISEGDDDTYDG